MFKNLRTGTKLIVLCGAFVVSIVVATYDLVAEKQIAIDFARKELAGSQSLAVLRSVYAVVLASQPTNGNWAQLNASMDKLISALSSANSSTAVTPETSKLAQELANKLREFQSHKGENEIAAALIPDTLAAASELASRIGDDSNLTLDPDLDTYYLQAIAVTRLPKLLGLLGVGRLSFGAIADPRPHLDGERKRRIPALGALLQSDTEEIKRNLVAGYRGNADGKLKQAVGDVFGNMIASTTAFVDDLQKSTAGGEAQTIAAVALQGDYTRAVQTAIDALAAAQSQLDQLLRQRIGTLRARLFRSLLMIGALCGVSMLILILTHRHIVQPLMRLESLARTVRRTSSYDLRSNETSQDEIGQLAVAFNDMLSELAAAREREFSKQSELARMSRLTTMGTMTASIAHEINQPLAAIVANSNAGLRWLGRSPPDLDEVRAVLTSIVDDGHRASKVIGSIRKLFKSTDQDRVLVDINDLVQEVLDLVRRQLWGQRISIQTDLVEDVPKVLADRFQLQQVLLNLILNAMEAMSAVTNRQRLLRITSDSRDHEHVLVTVGDTGTGIGPKDLDRIFDAFFTTKSDGMGMGLAICRSIVEAHGGRLWASANAVHGSIFYVELPGGA